MPAAWAAASTPPTRPAQVQYLCSDSRSVYLFVEDDEQLDKYLEVRERLPRLRKVIVFDMEGLAPASTIRRSSAWTRCARWAAST